MKRVITVLFFLSSLVFGQNAWINEFHYDNIGTSTGEFIEVAIEDYANYILSDFRISFYTENKLVIVKTNLHNIIIKSLKYHVQFPRCFDLNLLFA